jgi:two-component system sensor histidine kinase UhpB
MTFRAGSPQLYWKVCLINGAVFVAAAAVLVVSPATVSPDVTARELLVLVLGIMVILVTNALLLRRTLAPLDRLIQLMDEADASRSEGRLPDQGRSVAARLARSVNAMQDRLNAERATRSLRALSAQEAERQRIAHELHDEVGQRLTVVILGISHALDDVADGVADGAASELRFVQENARTSLDEVRRIARGLRPGVLEDLGLVAALEEMANEVASQSRIEVRAHLDPTLPPLRREAELVMFRVSQEALTNVTRHSGARAVDVTLRSLPGTIRLAVCDDGKTIDASSAGDGIRGMKERAQLIGGELYVGPRPDAGGTEVRLDVPLASAVR